MHPNHYYLAAKYLFKELN